MQNFIFDQQIVVNHRQVITSDHRLYTNQSVINFWTTLCPRCSLQANSCIAVAGLHSEQIFHEVI